ncbi:DUF397 domain-containing protein [Streptomyces sp. GESEQ-4]|uniref:DUF397 domain-containing protein n=1 Tax=Streptomyces sp. GESEQ-4 TaxID=2812655 RepID=UPI001B3283BE|nr:DUF397 domain-containing protein [Streptomyces sp. GESEQ-4]
MVDEGPSAKNWRVSSYSVNGETCVAVAEAAEGVLVRDTKEPAGEALIHLARTPWHLFLAGVRSQGFSTAT